MRVAILAQSTGARQLCELERIVAENAVNGWTSVGAYRDWRELFTDAKNRRFELVLFWSVEVLKRSTAVRAIQELLQLTDLGVRWRSLTDAHFQSDGAHGDAVIAVLRAVVKYERQWASQRTKDGIKSALDRGGRVGRPRANVEELTAEICKRRSEGHTLRWIGRRLGISKDTVRRVLKARDANP